MAPQSQPMCLLMGVFMGLLLASAGTKAPGAEGLTGPPSGAASGGTLLERISAQAADVTTISGHFVQRTLNPGDTQPELRQGRFELQVPDCYNLIETRPDDANWKKRICSDGVTQWEIEQVFPDVKPETTQHQAGAADHDLRRILSCIRGDMTDLQRDFAITASEANGGFQLLLIPRSDEVARDVTRVAIALDGHSHVQSLVLEQPSGTHITLAVSQAAYNLPLKAEDFHYQSP